MKILMTVDFDPSVMESGGVGVNIRYLAKEFRRLGHSVMIGYPRELGAKLVPGISTVGLELDASMFNDYDLVIFMGTAALRTLFRVAPRVLIDKKRKFVLYFRATSPVRRYHARFRGMNNVETRELDQEMEQVVRSPYSILVANSVAMKKDIRQLFPSARDKDIHVIYPGTVWPRNISRRKEKEFTFISVGRLSVEKGILTTLEAFALLDKYLKETGSKRHVRLKIIGTGELEQSLTTFVRAMGIDSSVEFLGSVGHQKIYKQLARAHVLVHPSITEAFGNVIVEALGVGTPVIASNFEGPKEILRNGEFGKLIQPMDVLALYRLMKRSIIDAGFYSELVDRGKQSNVRDCYSVQRQARELLELV